MKQEVNVTCDFLRLLVQRFGSIPADELELFCERLEKQLLQQYQHHWYPGKFDCISRAGRCRLLRLDQPERGNGFRSLNFNVENVFCDKIISEICFQLCLPIATLGIHFEFTIWTDPKEVSIRYVDDSSE
jgi:protein Tob/BTG